MDDIYDVMILFARLFHKPGQRALLVGGAVRDMITGQPVKDLDFEVYGVTPDELEATLSIVGTVNAVGKSFGVLKVKYRGFDFDVSIPRRENKVGAGHKGFIAHPDPTMTPKQAAARRDFTFNAMAYDPLTTELLDFFSGKQDLENRVLRHTSDAFAEDPLRVLRGMQFCGRFDLTETPDTLRMCRKLAPEYHTLSVERVWSEWEKWATKSVRPSAGLEFLRRTGWVWIWLELANLISLSQDPVYHPEGDVWTHTLQTVDAAVEICNREGITGDDKAVMVLAALCHDFGKIYTTEACYGRIISHGHDKAGIEPTEQFLADIGCPESLRPRIVALVSEHMVHVSSEPNARTTRNLAKRLSSAGENIRHWAVVVEADHSGRKPLPGGLPEQAKKILDLAKQERVEHDKPAPVWLGRHLLSLGYKPGKEMGVILHELYQAQLDGTLDEAEAKYIRRL